MVALAVKVYARVGIGLDLRCLSASLDLDMRMRPLAPTLGGGDPDLWHRAAAAVPSKAVPSAPRSYRSRAPSAC